MAITNVYVNPAGAADDGDGLDTVGDLITGNAGLVNATYDHTGNGEGERHLLLASAFDTYTHLTGHIIYLKNAAGGIVEGVYTIASKVDGDAILLEDDAGLTADSSADVDSADGPFGDLEFAIEQTTFDTTNGTRMNIKAGTDEVLVAVINTAMDDTVTTAAWAPVEGAPCIFRGYTAFAEDGGIGGISGGGSVGIQTNTSENFVSFIDLHLHNCGSANVIDMNTDCSIINCEVDNTTGSGILIGTFGVAQGNYVHNTGGFGIEVSNGGVISFNYVENGATDFTVAIQTTAGSSVVFRNIVKVDGTTDGIVISEDTTALHNSVWSNAGTGEGFRPVTNNKLISQVINNIVEGFSGAGGNGFDFSAAGTRIKVYGGNAAYDNTTEYSAPVLVVHSLGDNETLSASPFTDAANGDFSPVDTGNVKEGALLADFGNGQ